MYRSKVHFVSVTFCLLSVTITWADILVNVNVNKPIHDVSEQFVSFSIQPELLFKSLDGPHKKTLTDMASLLGSSYIKLVGDYFFANDLKTNLRNPTQSIWSGFNRWTRAMNWTMVIPVQYTPLSWDPTEALRVLNISNAIGIDSCVWQLGLDFGTSRASDYVADLNTLDTMVDTFRPYVKSWKVIGAEITAGSSAEETKRYIDISKDINAAYGWTQPAGYHIEENVNGYIYDKDPALKSMLEKKVPIWLSIPPKGLANQISNVYTSIEVAEALRWAQTLGDAASTGFDAVFKPISADDVSDTNYSFFVTALFKKIMGNRVFAAKPVKRFSSATKLYTHCANGISGGVVFMGVNTEDYSVKVSARPSAKFTGSEVWQFVLTSKKGSTYLNNDDLNLSSTLEPFVRIKHPNKPLAITMPPMSVGFWVLPLANLEDCQFTELLSSYNPETHWESKQRKQTASDRLLKKLIFETSFTDQMKNHRRRNVRNSPSTIVSRNYIMKNSNVVSRHRRFLLQDPCISDPVLAKINPKSLLDEKKYKKREDPQNWLQTLKQIALPKMDWGLKRSRRAVDFIDSLFGKESPTPTKQTQNGTKSKIENEADIFKTEDNKEIELPTGDVHIQYITGQDGEEIHVKKSRDDPEEDKEQDVQIKELPSEFYESVPLEKYASKPITNNANSRSRSDGISSYPMPSDYMNRNNMDKQFEEVQMERVQAFNARTATEESTKPDPDTEYTVQHFTKGEDNFQKFLYDSSESHSSSSLKGSRFRRAIDYNNLNLLQDNMITKDEYVKPLSDILSGISEAITEHPDNDSNLQQGVVSKFKDRVSKILSTVKNRLSDLLNSLVK